MKYYIIAGEASGDLHGSNLIMALKQKDPNALFRVWGGDKMKATGASLASNYNEMSFMGFVGLLSNIRKVFQKLKFCKKDILAFQPDALIFIDFSGFNLRIAKWAKNLNFKKFYYISPQVWASRSNRIETIKATIDKMFCILPFEKAFYAQHNYEVEYVGHPLMDEIDNFQPNNNFKESNQLNDLPIIALLPGSRKQEIESVLKTLIEIIPHFKQHQFVIAGAPGIQKEIYLNTLSSLKDSAQVNIIYNQTYDILNVAHAAVVTSGTATLETALFKVPQVVVYKGSTINYWIARQIVKVKYISLVNLISDKEIVKELIQSELNPQNLQDELNKIIKGSHRDIQLTNYQELIKIIGGPGTADKTAQGIIELSTKN